MDVFIVSLFDAVRSPRVVVVVCRRTWWMRSLCRCLTLSGLLESSLWFVGGRGGCVRCAVV